MRKDQLVTASEIAKALHEQAEQLYLTVSAIGEPVMHDVKCQNEPFQVSCMFGTWAMQVETNKQGPSGWNYDLKMWAPRGELPLQIASRYPGKNMILVSHEALGAETTVVSRMIGRMVERLVIHRMEATAVAAK